MMAMMREPSANKHCRKRSFDDVLETEHHLNPQPHRPRQHGHTARTVIYLPVTPSKPPTTKRRFKNHNCSPSMPVHIVPVMSTTYPSFMSVFGSNDSPVDVEHAEAHAKEQELLLKSTLNTQNPTYPHPSQIFSIHHRGSVTSMATESTASSPTTTHSSPMFTDPSPSSSPESASSNPPLSPFRTIMRLSDQDRQQNSEQAAEAPTQQTLHEPLHQKSDPSNLGSKNVKNLSLNMSAPVLPRPTSSASLDSTSTFSAPVSPLREAQRSGRKKPTNLTIRTPGFQQVSFPRATPDVPPTPSSRPSITHFPSSPAFSSATNSSGGLHLSLPSFGSGHSRPGSDSSFTSQSATSSLPGLREEHEAQRSQETPERGYPSGPIQIYDSGVFLYLEPNLEEASKFDTVINVAKEIKNPFEATDTENKTVVSIWREDQNRSQIAEPQTAVSEKSFRSAWEFQPAEAPTPTTPRPQSSSSRKEPEYLHVPWDHNSEILDDLYPLCKLIDDRVQDGKKVLIHCQLGVSRSASLVIAYGLFKGFQPDFHSMYMQVKERSQWVGPNMSLIYQLTDFRLKVVRGQYENGGRVAPAHWFKNPVPSQPSVPDSAPSQQDASVSSHEEDDDPSKTPQASKPIRSLKLDKELPPVPIFPKDDKPRPTPHIIEQLASSITASASVKRTKSKSPRPSQRVKEAAESKPPPEPRTLPFRKLSEFGKLASIPPHRPRNGPPPGLHIRQPSAQMDLAQQDVPSTPSLFSPRSAEFTTSPFGISSSVGEVAYSAPQSAKSVVSISPPGQQSSLFTHKPYNPSLPSNVDPRSPHQQGEHGEILRHIDDFL